MGKKKGKKKPVQLIPTPTKKRTPRATDVFKKLAQDVVKKVDPKIAEMVTRNVARWRCKNKPCGIVSELHMRETKETAECPCCGSKNMERAPDLKLIEGGKTEKQTP